MNRTTLALAAAAGLLLAGRAGAEPALKALIIDGQNNHKWKVTTPLLKKILEDSGLFKVDVATSPPGGRAMASFQPNFKDYHVVVSNYNGGEWSTKTKKAFAEYVKNGGGFVSVHAANNSFPGWPEYNEMIGVGGWGGRNEKSGPYIRYKDGKMVLDTSKGTGGSHGRQHRFVVEVRDKEHPITRGLPARWLHDQDELYDRLRGPAKNVTLLATAFSDKSTSGTGLDEPMLFTVAYGKGRVFHTTLGHDVPAIQCVGFIVTLQRGAEWAATGKVTQKVPDDFPTEKEVKTRQLKAK